MSSIALTNQNILIAILDELENRGFNPQTICSDFDVSYVDLVGQKILLSTNQYEELYKECVVKSKDDSLGFHVGLNSKINELGLLGQLFVNAKDVRQLIEVSVRYAEVLSDGKLTISFKSEKDLFTLHLTPNKSWIIKYPYRTRGLVLYHLANMLDILNKITLIAQSSVSDFFSKTINTIYVPHYIKNLSLFNRLDYNFLNGETETAIISGHISILDIKVQNSDPAIFNMLIEKLESAISDKKRTWKTKAINYLFENLEHPDCSLEEVAQSLNVSPRTLQRKLSEENTTFKEIEENVKFELAKQLLIESQNIDYVSSKLHFSDRSSFSRAFKRWSGKSIKNYLSSLE